MPSGYAGTRAPHGTYTRYAKWGCHCEECREANREHYRKYKPSRVARQHLKEYRRNRQAAKKLSRRAYLNALKQVPCKDCGQSYPPYCMDFDHVPERGPREFWLSHWASFSMPWDKLDAEIAKCDVVCAICHRKRTYIRQHAALDVAVLAGTAALQTNVR